MSTLEQAISEGYKQTDVGVIPIDWESINFGDLFEQSISRKPIKASDPVTFIGMQDVSESAQLTNPQQRVFEQVKTGFTYFERNDVLVAKITPCFENGKGCYTDKITTRIGFGSTEFHVLRAKENSDAKFIYFWTTRNSLRQDLEGEMVGSAGHRRVPFSAIQNYLIPCPSSRIEQTAIANALSDVDALLTELEKLIAKKQAIKTATMQQLLTGKTRLPQFATYTEGEKQGQQKGTKPSELGEIPEDWDVYFLDQLITSTQLGGNYSNSEAESSFPLIKMGNLGRGKIKLDKLEYANEAVSARDRLKFDDVLFNTRNTLELVGKVAIWKDELPEAYFNSNIMRFVFNNNLVSSNSYMNAAMNTKKFVTDLAGIATGTTSVAAIYTRDLLQLKLLIPPKEEQTAIATILSDMDNEIQTLEQRLVKTRQIKQGMMQELLTGRTRLPFDKEAQQGN
jgi:type I restriction enzyme S subunit